MNWVSAPLSVDIGPAVVVRTKTVRTASQHPPALLKLPPGLNSRVNYRGTRRMVRTGDPGHNIALSWDDTNLE